MTPEISAKISATLSGKPKTSAHRAALRKAKSVKRTLSPAHAAALAAGRDAYWAGKRARSTAWLAISGVAEVRASPASELVRRA